MSWHAVKINQLILQVFHTNSSCFLLLFFNWTLSDSKSLQISRTLQSILADLNNAVVWIVSILPLTYSFLNLFPRPFGNIPMALITIGITVTFMCHSFFLPSGKIQVFVCLFAFFHFHSTVHWKGSLVLWPGLGDPVVSQNLWEFYVSHFHEQILVCVHSICQHGQILISDTILIGQPKIIWYFDFYLIFNFLSQCI